MPGAPRPPPEVVVAATVRRLAVSGAPEPPGEDAVAVEAPLEVRFAGRPAVVLMRTPGEDEDLLRGFLLSEGVVRGAADLVRIRRPDGLTGPHAGNVVEVEVAPSPGGSALDRGTFSSSSCGACGRRSIAALEIRAAACTSPLRVPRALLASLPERLRGAQRAFEHTGGVHACGLFASDGSLLVLREDVGRHNAVDKVLGWALARDVLPLGDHVLMVSGRVSYDLAQKAVLAGVPILVAIGAPSSFAVEICERHGLTLVGFLRPSSMNVYTGAERIL